MGSTAITFPGAQGHALAARLDVPSDSQYAAGVLAAWVARFVPLAAYQSSASR